MTTTDDDRARMVRTIMERLLRPEGAVRAMALETGLSEQTIRVVASTGDLSSMRTAAALEAATGGALTVADHMRSDARGAETYSRFPGDRILAIALERRCSAGDVLASVGLTQQDLSTMAHGTPEASRRMAVRVRGALALLGIDQAEVAA